MSQMQSSPQTQQSGQSQQNRQSIQSRTGPSPQQFPTRNYLSQQVRTASITALNQALADLTAVNMQLKTAHWNVRGPDFYQLHELFEDLVETFEPFIDMLAERASALGGQALGTAPVTAEKSNVPQMQPTLSSEQALLEQIADSLAALDATLYQQINTCSEQGDLDSADLLNEVSREVSEALWFVEAHLQGGRGQTANQSIQQQATGGQQFALQQ